MGWGFLALPAAGEDPKCFEAGGHLLRSSKSLGKCLFSMGLVELRQAQHNAAPGIPSITHSSLGFMTGGKVYSLSRKTTVF